MPFDAVKCRVEFRDGIYTVTMTVRYLDAGSLVLASKPISVKVAKADGPTMRAELQAKLIPILDQSVLDLPDEVSGQTNIVTQILTQVNSYLATK